MKHTYRFFTYFGSTLLAIFCTFHPLQADQRVALVIGNSDYPDQSVFSDLDNSVNDARIMAKSLSEAGFTVLLAKDADRTAMRMHLRDFEAKIEPGGVALFYFAGHGIQFEGENFLMGCNARFENKFELGDESLKADTVLRAMSGKKPKTAMVFLDCCRESPPKSWMDGETRGIKPRGLSGMQHPDVVISFAAAPDKPALDGKDLNSPFALALSSEILKGNEITTVLKSVARTVYETTGQQQRPWWNGSFLHDFYFTKPNVPRQVQPGGTMPAQAQMLHAAVGTSVTPVYPTMATGLASTPLTAVESSVGQPYQPPTTGNIVEITGSAPPAAPQPLVLPSKGYFSNAEVFRDGPYEYYNDSSKKRILKMAQEKMKGAGYPDGKMGKNTQASIINYQRENQLAVTGLLDAPTLSHAQLLGLSEQSYTSSGSSRTRGSSSSNYSSSRSSSTRSSGSNLDNVHKASESLRNVGSFIRAVR
ncbi:MAG: caspase family protein [Verrucomicrobiales bacterium]|nr:caspase family protein [Verrucomicrobiales bacterium]